MSTIKSYTKPDNISVNIESNPNKIILVDTSAFIALRDARDVNHVRAKNVLKEIKNMRTPLLTTNFIFDEVYTYFSRFHEVAVEMGEFIRNSPGIILYHRVTAEEENRAWEIARSYRDKTFSFTDCTSFAVCENLQLKDVFVFDEHFRQYGRFNVLP